jgi:SAM-dependent methyltransferase
MTMSKGQRADFLEDVRLSELGQIRQLLSELVKPGARILEIGAGTGWQARELSRLGYEVCAIDIPTSNHGAKRIWPIVDFDGSHIPFLDGSFDVVYSSNVLEHVYELDTLNTEMGRVLKPGGHAIHYVPTSAWRAWSLLAFYPTLVREVFRRGSRLLESSGTEAAVEGHGELAPSSAGQVELLQKVLGRLFPHAHGAQGSCLHELNRFQQQSWDRFFKRSGWIIESYTRNGMFLTGEMLAAQRLSIGRRQRLSRWLGCTAHLYVLKTASGA